MCGIAGFVGRRSNLPVVECMVQKMHHRGPDDHGVISDHRCTIGMTRLSILDLSKSGHQPMQSHCGRYWIVYNGECYNFQTIRVTLQKEGCFFRSNSDTEVVLQAFVKWGEESLKYLNGMFAFAIWDCQTRELFAARDRFGIKPFYYATRGDAFVFASEIKTVLASGLVDVEMDVKSLIEYFSFGYVQQPRTILKDVHALMPGHWLSWKDGKIETRRYWGIAPGSTKDFSYEEAKETLLAMIQSSVKMQMISDRPLGLFLSGGLDSASVLAAMTHNGAISHTFSIGFDQNPFVKNEETETRELAGYFGARHEQVTLDTSSVLEDIPRFFDRLDQPSVDGLNTYLVSKYATTAMTVALSGLGGDELFAGYSRHALLMWKSTHRSNQFFSRLFPLKQILKVSGKAGELLWKIRAFGESDDALLNYAFSRSHEAPGNLNDYLTDDVLDRADLYATYVGAHRGLHNGFPNGSLDQILSVDIQAFMSSLLLRDMDATSMAHSLEVRFPLIDHELVEFAFSLPAEYKLDPRVKGKPKPEGTYSYKQAGAKRILLDAMEPLLPPGFSTRPKNGFKLPFEYWLRQYKPSQLKGMMLDERPNWEPYLKGHFVERCINNFIAGGGSAQQVWKLLSFVGVLSSLKNAARPAKAPRLEISA